MCQRSTQALTIDQENQENDFSWEDNIVKDIKNILFNKWSIPQAIALTILCSSLIITFKISQAKKWKVLELSAWKWEVLALVIVSGHLLSIFFFGKYVTSCSGMAFCILATSLGG